MMKYLFLLLVVPISLFPSNKVLRTDNIPHLRFLLVNTVVKSCQGITKGPDTCYLGLLIKS